MTQARWVGEFPDPNQAVGSQRKQKNRGVELAATLQVSLFFVFWLLFHAQNLKLSQNQDFGIDMAWSVLKFLIFCDNPYRVLVSAFQHLPRNIAVDSPKCQTVDTFEVFWSFMLKTCNSRKIQNLESIWRGAS